MKTLTSQIPASRFPFVFLSIALLVKGIIILWFIRHIYGLDVAHQHDILSVILIIIVLVITLFAWLTTIRDLHRSRKTIIANKAEQTRTKEALQQSEARFRELFENANDLVYTTDLQGNFTSLNKVGEIITGYMQNEACEMHFKQVVAREYLELARGMLALKQENNIPTAYEIEFITKSGKRIALDISNRLIYEAGEPIGVQGIGRDVTARRHAEETLRESEARYRVVTESASDAILTIDREHTILFVNSAAKKIFGYAVDEMLGNKLFMLMPEYLRDAHAAGMQHYIETNKKNISWQGVEVLGLHKDGYEIPIEINFGEINSDGRRLFTAVIRDISERRRAEEKIRESKEWLQAIFDASRDGIIIEDGAKVTYINKSYTSLGHAEGDKLLNQIARRLEFSTRTGDLVARLGGDEFVILLSEMLAESDAVVVAERIQNNLKNSFDLNGNDVFISASIGIALSNAGHIRAEDMVRDADIAMYRAKAKGKAQYQVFNQAMHEYASKQLELENEMRQSLEREEFQLYYQPIISLKTETLVGFEALVRWRHPTRGLILPLEFIPAAEENGLILPLGNWILRESCRQLRRWQDDNPSALRLMVSVNLSCKQFLHLDLAEQIAATLDESGLDPRCLKLEITESYIMENSEMAVTIMNRLRSLGVEISLDDFGTGYSSLSYLHSLPVDYLKVDRSFVSRMTASKENSEIVSTIIKLAQNLKMKVIAEGIETAAQLVQLKQLHCEYGQGYFFSKPLEAEAAKKFIEQNGENFPLVLNETDVRFELNI
ncbi:MAG: EAL domain-containing protein [Acidobacteriota bacterium]|nr:EAL domain-containing protein [Acidobacteriota bacterium]